MAHERFEANASYVESADTITSQIHARGAARRWGSQGFHDVRSSQLAASFPRSLSARLILALCLRVTLFLPICRRDHVCQSPTSSIEGCCIPW